YTTNSKLKNNNNLRSKIKISPFSYVPLGRAAKRELRTCAGAEIIYKNERSWHQNFTSERALMYFCPA
ncbi:MAG: hypothetical protein AAFV25_15450, partial [Bacteroidota bacterium]